ncbi:MAG: PEGA domain-containing protein [Prevotella sp.]|nr:PEGA domain-containing protein [Candidatus Prevotella equi]
MYRTEKYKLLLVCLLTTVMQFCYAQEKLEFNIISFDPDPFSTSAQDKRFEKTDGDNNRYAIIKVKDANGETDLKGFTFNFGSLNSFVESHDDELWVYVQRNAKTVTIKRPGYKTIEKYNLNLTIKPGKVYVMKITMSRAKIIIEHDITKQVLQFVVSPSKENAVVKVKKVDSNSDFELWGVVDETGSIDKIMDFGTYDYMVSAVNYEPSSGRVTLSDSKNNFVENVMLKPNFGFLVVDDAYGISGAQIFVDDVMIGTVPYRDTNKRWNCGEHKITITNGDLYKPFNSTFTIEQGDTTHLSPKLESDFAQTTIHVDADAEIFIDGKSKGRSTWTGPLKAGKYVVECKQDNHRPSSIAINVKVDKAETFEVPAPIAITGSLYVRSTPSGATIEIDGKDNGTTPKLIQNVLIGNHTVRLTKTNHKTEQYDVIVKEGQTENLEAVLSDIAHMTITSKPSGAKIIINGENWGSTPYYGDMSSGDYDIEIRHKKYQTFHKNVHLDSSNPTMEIALKRQYQRPYSIYIQPFFQVGSNMSVGGAVGGYIANVNVEGYYAMGMKESEMIYWNATEGNEKPCGYTYKASTMGGRVGYGFVLKTRMRLTPQVGLGVTNISSSKTYNTTASFDASKAYAVNASIGAKFEYAFISCLGAFVAPEYSFAVKKSKYFEDMESVSSTIKGFGSGFNCRIGLSLFF